MTWCPWFPVSDLENRQTAKNTLYRRSGRQSFPARIILLTFERLEAQQHAGTISIDDGQEKNFCR